MIFQMIDGTVVTASVPVFITGSGRCGTTLMRRLVIERSKTVIPPENYTLGAIGHFQGGGQAGWEAYCRGILSHLTANRDDWTSFAIDEARALQHLSSIPPEAQSAANFWHAFHAIYAQSAGKDSSFRWGDKTPLNVGRLGHIRSIFPDARFVFMVRDVLDVSYSYGNMPILGRQGKYLEGAKRWIDANSRIKAFTEANPGSAIVVRYEDLVVDPDAQVAKVIDFAGLERSEGQGITASESRDIRTKSHLQNALGEVRNDFVGKGRDGLSADLKAAILADAAPLQRFFGYDTEGRAHSV